jgi:hypothetical protein
MGQCLCESSRGSTMHGSTFVDYILPISPLKSASIFRNVGARISVGETHRHAPISFWCCASVSFSCTLPGRRSTRHRSTRL